MADGAVIYLVFSSPLQGQANLIVSEMDWHNRVRGRRMESMDTHKGNSHYTAPARCLCRENQAKHIELSQKDDWI